MPATGRDFELKQNVFRDDRRDVLASTRAALDYLQQLHGMFGDWHLALAAYNWGEGNVQRAIARNQQAGLPTDYASLRMPDETRNYVPKLQAVKNIVARPEAFGLTLPALENHPYFLSVPIERDIDVDARGAAGRPAARRVPAAQPADEQAGDPGRRHAAGAAALRQRQPFVRNAERSTAARWPAGRPGSRRRRCSPADAAQAGRHERGRSCARSTASRRACWSRPARRLLVPRGEHSAATTCRSTSPTTR